MGDIFAGRYELVDPLGEGGSGTVWRVWDHKRQRYCAAKVLRQVDATSLLRFIREQSLRLEHQHVLAPTGWAGEDDKVLFTMPMIRGGSVATLVGDFGPLPPRLVVLLLDQLLTALEVLHAEGIVHRDVKPANLLLDASGGDRPNLWLGDFGIAAGVDEPRLTTGPYALGTPGYLAPECMTRGWDPDPKADLYAAGMCAVEMITGMKPERGTGAAEALAEADLPYELPQTLIDVVHRLAAPSMTARFDSAGQAKGRLWESGLMPQDIPPEQILGEVELFDHIPPLPEGWEELPEAQEAQEPEVPSGTMPQVPLPGAPAEEVAPETPGAAGAEEQGESTEMRGIRNVPTAPVGHQEPTGPAPTAPYDVNQTGPDYPLPSQAAPAAPQQPDWNQPPQQPPQYDAGYGAPAYGAASYPSPDQQTGPLSTGAHPMMPLSAPQLYRSGAGKSFAISAGLLAVGVLLLILTIWLATY